MNRARLIVFLCLGLLASQAGLVSGAEVRAYDIYSTAVTGSARNVGLSGSAIAYPDDYAAGFINPAGLAGLSGKGIDFGSDSNSVENFVVDLDDPKSRSLNDPLKYGYYGVRYITDKGWGWGVSAQTPFEFDSTFLNQGTTRKKRQTIVVTTNDETEVKIVANTYTAAGGRSFLDRRLAVGLALNYHRIDESFDFRPALASTAPVTRSAVRDQLSADLGLMGKPWPWLRLGAVYKMGYRVGFEGTLNDGLPGGVKTFHDVKMPDRLSFGLAWMPVRKFSLFLRGTYVYKMQNTFVVASGILPTSPGAAVAAGQYDTANGYWGAELVPIDEPDLTFKLWAGGYLENTGIQGGYNRYHRTAGFGLSPWFLNLSMAVDDAEFYNNFVVGLGVDLLQLSQRIATKYGWKLPL